MSRFRAGGTADKNEKRRTAALPRRECELLSFAKVNLQALFVNKPQMVMEIHLKMATGFIHKSSGLAQLQAHSFLLPERPINPANAFAYSLATFENDN